MTKIPVEQPILFSADMVKAILDGQKTVTRRVINIPAYYHLAKKPQSYGPDDYAFLDMADPIGTYPTLVKPRYHAGDLLWVKETYCHGIEWDDCKPSEVDPLCGGNDIWYFADGERPTEGWGKKRSSRFMPKWAARIWLEVLNVRPPEKLQDISDIEAEKEGCLRISTYRTKTPCLDHFPYLWDSINAKRGYPWDNNDWVWPYEFKINR